jgi:hypothetical protein
MTAFALRLGGYVFGLRDVALWVAIAFALLLAVVGGAMFLKGWPRKKSQWKNYEDVAREILARKFDHSRKDAEKKRLAGTVSGMRSAIGSTQKVVEEKSGQSKELDGKIAFAEKEGERLRERLREMEAEKSRLEREVQDLKLCSKLRQRAVVSGKPGDEFFVRFKFEGEAEKPGYLEVMRGVGAFSVPSELPGISGDGVVWAFSEKRQGPVVVVDGAAAAALRGRLFFVGDIHGDADALRRALEFAFRSDEKSVVVFLGDLFDRGDKSLEAARMLLWAARTLPGQVLWLCGNHDMGLRYEESSGTFASGVEPSEFKDYLNAHPELKDEGIALVRIIETLPVACVIGNLWASHGGVPHNDVSGDFTSFDAMSTEMRDDCVWSRMKDVPAKLPNRAHRGAEVGFKDAKLFFDVLAKKTGLAIRHVVCAHQHERTGDVGYLQFKRYYKPEDLSCQCIFTFADRDHDAQPCILIYNGTDIPPVPHTV